jgi:hypothetical protein
MIFTIEQQKDNTVTLLHRLGYTVLDYTEKGELNCVRTLGGSYPRFHAYVREGVKRVVFNLHLDQKKPSYKDTRAHSGEYDGELVEEESRRIKEKVTHRVASSS